jgi:Holliday junction resolvasome RuvABC endonuclease subunit
MRYGFKNTLRVLAIDPFHKGFGFAVMEEPLQLVDFGLKIPTKNKGKISERLKNVEAIIDHYQPDVLVVEDSQATECKRGRRAREMLQGIEKLVSGRDIEVMKISQPLVQQIVTAPGSSTKYTVATKIAGQFQELKVLLPRYRKPWMTEDETMNIFDATALAVTILLRRRTG